MVTVFRVSEFDERRGTQAVLVRARVPGDGLSSTTSTGAVQPVRSFFLKLLHRTEQDTRYSSYEMDRSTTLRDPVDIDSLGGCNEHTQGL